jgi:hypothetical protein
VHNSNFNAPALKRTYQYKEIATIVVDLYIYLNHNSLSFLLLSYTNFYNNNNNNNNKMPPVVSSGFPPVNNIYSGPNSPTPPPVVCKSNPYIYAIYGPKNPIY